MERLRHSSGCTSLLSMAPWRSGRLGWGLGSLPRVPSASHADRATRSPPPLQCLLFQLPAGSGFEAVPGLFGAVCKQQSFGWAPGSSPVLLVQP